jgi:hypothetical protein
LPGELATFVAGLATLVADFFATAVFLGVDLAAAAGMAFAAVFFALPALVADWADFAACFLAAIVRSRDNP